MENFVLNLGNIFIASLLSFVVTYYVIPVITKIAKLKKLYDIPDERKIHTTPIPSLGGIGIFVGFVLGLLIFDNENFSNNNLPYYIASYLIIFFVGLKDDILIISPLKKLMGQIFVALILIFKAKLLINNMHGFLGIYEIVPILSIPITVLTIVVTMNAFNLIDGVDGLAGCISIVTACAFGLFFFFNNDIFYSLMAFTFSASLFAFLFYNFSSSKKIFMGDTGSMLSGTLNVILVIHFIDSAHLSTSIPVSSAPAMGFGILMLPLLDTLRVFGMRMMKGRSPFSPDRNHLHHLLLDKGFTHKQITATLSIVAAIFIIISYYSQPLGTTGLILGQTGIFFVGIFLLQFFNKKEVKKPQSKKVNPKEDFNNKVTSIITYIGNRHAVLEND